MFATRKAHKTHQAAQDVEALVVSAVVGQQAALHQHQTIEEDPGAKPQQCEEQRPPTGAQPPQEAQPRPQH